MEPALNIGELARQSGVNVDTVRYYERRGLLPAPRRSAAGYRKFQPELVQQIRFIKHAQALGFTLNEIKDLLSIRVHPEVSCAGVHVQARAKLAAIDEKIESLRSIRTALLKLTASCEGSVSVGECHILEAIEDADPR